MPKSINLFIEAQILLDNEDIDRISSYDWEMDKEINIYTRIGFGKFTLARMVVQFYHSIADNECVKHINGDRFDNRKANLAIVKKTVGSEPVEAPAPAPAPAPAQENMELPKYVYLKNGKFCVYQKVEGKSRYVCQKDTLEEAIAERLLIEKQEVTPRKTKGSIA